MVKRSIRITLNYEQVYTLYKLPIKSVYVLKRRVNNVNKIINFLNKIV